MSSIDQQFVEFIVKSLVGNPDAVVVDRKIDERGVLLELTVAPEDLGRVIGKRGTTAQSLRVLLRALGTKNEARYNLKIVDVDRLGDGSAQTSSVSTSTSSDDDDDDDDISTSAVDESTDQPVDNDQQRREKTRKELAEYDDLDI